MKHLISLLLAMVMVIFCFSGCSGSAAPGGGNAGAGVELREQEKTEICENAFGILLDTLPLPESAREDLAAQSVQRYEDEDVVRYTQTWQGVEIFGSSLVVASGGDSLCLGTYYDLSGAFGDDFQDIVAQANTVPDWMTDYSNGTSSLYYQTETLRAVIYILPDNSAVVARRVEAAYTTSTGVTEYTMVFSLDGSTIYTCQTYDNGYSDATVTGPSGESAEVIKEKGSYYAYNQELNFYIYDEDMDEASKHITGSGAKQDLDLMYSSTKSEWTSGKAKKVLDAMTAFGDVASWYRDVVGYDGIDGKGGTAMVIISDEVTTSVAMNAHRYGYITYLYTTPHGYTAIDAPEILAHEYGHAVIKNISGTNGSGQTAALCEAICDCFGAAYLEGWHLAANLAVDGTNKDIAGTEMTMDDYIYDTLDDYGEELNDHFDNGFYSFLYEIYDHTSVAGMIDDYITMSSDSYHYHDNAFVISHTLYRIWKEVLSGNYQLFANILCNSIRYLPTDATFSDFRTAFLYSARKIYDTDTVAYASTFFDVAGIRGSETAQLVNIGTPEDHSTFTYSMLLSMSYDEISKMDWDEAYHFDSFDYPGQWYFNGMIGQGQVYIDFTGTEADPHAYPNSVAVYDMAGGTAQMQILRDVFTGMTFSEIKQVLPGLSELIDDEILCSLYATCTLSDGTSVFLYFNNALGEPVLENAIISGDD